MSAIFTFMKTLDPSSVVRETEFNSAANTAWVLNPSAIFQKIEKNANWKFLTQKQREDFKKIAIEFIKNKANNYNIKYNDLLKRYWEYWIDPKLAPTNMAESVISQLEWWNTETKQPTNWYDKYTTVWGVWEAWAWNVVTVWWTTYSSNFYDN
jgi:intergrase/recombinase